jgi:hypothetical protein
MGIIYKGNLADLSCPFEQVCGQFVIYSEINMRSKYLEKEAGIFAKSCHMNFSTAVNVIVVLYSWT